MLIADEIENEDTVNLSSEAEIDDFCELIRQKSQNLCKRFDQLFRFFLE